MRVGTLRLYRMVAKELRQLFRDPKTARIIFVAPVIQVIMLGYAVNTDVRHVPLLVVDHDRTANSRAVVEAMTASGYFDLAASSDRENDALDALDDGSAIVALIIPPKFSADLQAGRGPAVQLLLDGTSSNTATVAQGHAGQIITRFGIEVLLGRAPGAETPGVNLRTRAAFNPGLESRVYNVPGIIATIVLMMALLLTAIGVARERELGTLDQLMVSPLTPGQFMLGKTIPVVFVAVLQMALISAIALYWFKIPFQGSVLLLLAGSVLYILAGLSLGLILASFTRTQQEAFLGLFLFIMPAIILSGFMFPVETMPEVFQIVTLLNPLRHFLEVVRAIFLKGAGLQDLWQQFTWLGAMAAGGMLVANARFRRSMG